MKHHYLADALVPTDRILTRWAKSVGDGLYDAAWDEVPYNRAPELDDQTAIVVDQLVLRAPEQTRKLVEMWYRTTIPCRVIAQRLRCDETALTVRWNAALYHFKSHFESSPLSTLRKLALSDVADRTRVVYTETVNWACRLSMKTREKPAA